MKRRRKYDDEIDNKILAILEDIKIGTPETIRKNYKKYYEKELSWITIKEHLESLSDRNIINKRILSKGKKRELSVYSMSKYDN